VCATLAACLSLVVAPAARAQPVDRRAAAQVLFEQGRVLMNANRYAEACTKLEESHQIEPASGTLLNLADCYEQIGRTATAYEVFLDVAAIASQSPSLAKYETFARERANALQPKLSKMRVTVSATATGLSVHRDGIVLGPSDWGAAVAVDPGQHVVEASAPDKWDFRIMRYVPPGAALITVDVPALVDKSSKAPSPASSAASASAAPPPDAPAGAWRWPVGYTSMGLGLAAAGAGTFFFADNIFRAEDKNGNYEWEKPASLYMFAGASVLFGAGLYFLLSAPSAKKPPPVAGSPALLTW
jgi:tetratricopeptide (TPR) repeat protein